ncbi:MAG: hypothetical protein KDD62_06735 [Bdellovibrionales bacterium]|nr:hypothetical protein [Bdellovibrionales bacterium]
MVQKACEVCPSERISIGVTYAEVSAFRRFIGVTFIYLPIIFFPFVIVIACMTHFSLWILGARNLKRYKDFIPPMSSHRYNMSNQIVMDPRGPHLHLGWKIFWIFNCNYYCPLSVGLYDYIAYLVKAVENWWCPFHHARKSDYACAAIDSSYWHVKPGEIDKLHEDDLVNPIWNQGKEKTEK